MEYFREFRRIGWIDTVTHNVVAVTCGADDTPSGADETAADRVLGDP